MRSMQCNVGFGYQLNIRSGTKEKVFYREREREKKVESWEGVVRDTTVLEGGVIET
jgi:hypothetical protein